MRTSRLMALAAVLAAGVSTPAFAAWDRIGEVDFTWRGGHEREWGNFGGQVERLNFRAENNGVYCGNVRATFGNGNTRTIFRGFIRQGRSVDVDLPGYDRRVRRLDFNCRAEGRRDSTIIIFADIGRYRAEWRGSPDWQTRWSRMFHWDMGGDQFDRNQWVSLGRESFEGRGDHEVTYAGWGGRSINALALQPRNGDARCFRVVATFGNGNRRPLDIRGGDYLRQGGFYRIDLPGDERNVRRVDMVCRPVGDYQVTIELFAQK